MPSFTVQRPNLQADGPCAEIQIAVSIPAADALIADGKAVPAPINATAMIDTGATGTVIQEGLAARLGIHPVGITRISTPSSADVECNVYAVRIIFRQGVTAEATAIEAPLQGQNIQCLIGRDILAHGVLVYIGYVNQYTLSF